MPGHARLGLAGSGPHSPASRVPLGLGVPLETPLHRPDRRPFPIPPEPPGADTERAPQGRWPPHPTMARPAGSGKVLDYRVWQGGWWRVDRGKRGHHQRQCRRKQPCPQARGHRKAGTLWEGSVSWAWLSPRRCTTWDPESCPTTPLPAHPPRPQARVRSALPPRGFPALPCPRRWAPGRQGPEPLDGPLSRFLAAAPAPVGSHELFGLEGAGE